MNINVTITERELITVTFTESTSTRNATWGNISGDINSQEDLTDLIIAYAIAL